MSNDAQIEYWNGQAGQKWVRDADRLDAMLRPFADVVMDRAKPEAGESVLDIGCGAGALSLLAARTGASVSGVDVSEPLLDLARRRIREASLDVCFEKADASTWTTGNKFDVAMSRFGVMFFADPANAFHTIRSNIRLGGRLVFACWRPLSENDWALAPLLAVMPLLKEPPEPTPPGEPGPFAFGDENHVRDVLSRSGWSDIRVAPWDGLLEIPGKDAGETADFMLEIGPLSRLIKAQELNPDVIRAALVSWVGTVSGEDNRTRLKAAVWIVEATA